MAASDYFADEMLESTRDRCLLPASDDTLNDARLLRLMNDELRGYISALIVGVREEFILQTLDVALQDGVRLYRIPWRAVSSGIRMVSLATAEGDATPLERFDLEKKKENFGSAAGYGYGPFSRPGFFLHGDDVEVAFGSSLGTSLRFDFHYMPELVHVESAVKIESIASDRNSFVYTDQSPGQVEQWVKDDSYADFIRLGGGNQPMGLSTHIITHDTPSRTLTLDVGLTVPAGIVPGDYACNEGRSVVAPLPESLQPLLAQRTAYVALRSIGDTKAGAALDQLSEMKRDAVALLQPRTIGHPRKMINRFGVGRRRSGGAWRT